MATPTRSTRRRRRWHIILGTVLATVTLGAVVAWAADIQTDAVLGTSVATATEVSTGSNSFQIKVWATGNLPADKTGVANVVNKYLMATNGAITPSANPADQTELHFATGQNYTQNPPCGGTAATSIDGCVNKPFVVSATLVVATGTPSNTTGTLTVANTGSSGLSADSTPDQGVVKVAASNVAPVISWTANPSSADEGQTKTYSFSITDSDSSSWSFASSYPKCGTGGTLLSASIDNSAKTGTFECSFPDGLANPTVAAKVTDGTDVSNEVTQPVNVANVGPTALLANDGPVNESSSATVSFSGQSDVAGDGPFHYAYHCDGSAFATDPTYAGGSTSSSTSCPFGNDGSYTVKAAIIDKDGGFTVYSTTVTVNNVAPTISSVTNNGPVNEGGSVKITVSASDVFDALTYQFDCDNDGTFSAAQASNEYTCTMGNDGSQVVAVRVNDDDTNTDSSTTVTVNNVAPTISSVTNNGPVNEGSSATITVTASDPYDTLSYQFDCDNDGTFAAAQAGNQGSCTFADNGSYTVGVRVNDDDTNTDGSTTVTVNNVPPSITSALFSATSASCPVNGGDNATLSYVFADPGADSWTLYIDWDYDGTFSADNTYTGVGKTGSKTHSYPTNGAHTAAIKVADDDGGEGGPSSTSNSVFVLYNMTGILPPFNADGTSVWKYRSTIPVKVRITDCTGTSVGTLAPKVGYTILNPSDPPISVDEVESTSAADSGSTMRYDATAGQYIYNFASSSLPDGSATYLMRVSETHSTGVNNLGQALTGQSNQKFGMKLR